MTTFREYVLDPAEAAQEFIAKTGGLPEITDAAANLRIALAQTVREIEAAVFAERFPCQASDFFTIMHQTGTTLSAEAREAVEKEGEAGHKRVDLRCEVRQIEIELFGLIARLVEVRTDLIVSQDNFERSEGSL